MNPLTLRQIRQAVGGKALTVISENAPPISAISIDSRKVETDSLFIAVRGETFDGHAFLKDAVAGGAMAVIVSTPPAEALPGVAVIQVPDTRIALGRLARFIRQQFRGKVIAVAGSNGKTSTKHLIHAALRGRLKGSISPKSYNNDIGVPLSILAAEPLQDYLVLEVGTNHHGEIKPLSDMSLPDIAVITNCGAEHLEGLGDLMGVRRENAHITSGLNPKGLLVVNGDDPELLSALEWPGRKLTFGFKESNDLFATHVTCTPAGTEFSMNKRPQRAFVPMLGKHSAVNALAAIAVARSMRLPEEAIVESLAKSDGPEMRLQLQRADGVTILNDAYNANPNSMRAAIETFASLETAGRRVAVLGDMRELGESSERYHREIGAFLATSGRADMLVCVGPLSRFIADAAIAAGVPELRVTQFDDAASAAPVVTGMLQSGDLVLLKASRGIQLEKVAKAIGLRKEGPDNK